MLELKDCGMKKRREERICVRFEKCRRHLDVVILTLGFTFWRAHAEGMGRQIREREGRKRGLWVDY